MDASIIFQNLLDHNASKRVEILMVMRKLVKNSNGHLPFRNATRDAVFEVLHHVLDDVRWEVRYQCLLLIAAIVPYSNDEIDSCMLLVIPKIICNLGHENTNIRRAALQVIHVHMKYTNSLQHFQKLFVQYGLESQEYVTRKGCIISIGILFTAEFANENLYPLVESLSKHFVHGDASLFYPIFLAMQKINELVGPITFESYLQRLDQEAVNTYKRVLNKFYFNDSRMSSSSGSHSSISGNLNEHLASYNSKIVRYDFGIFESHVIEKTKSEDWKTRIEGIEHMKVVLKETVDLCEQIIDMDEFMVFLSKLLDDSNFKIVILTLSLYDLLIDKFRKEMKRFLKTFVYSVLKRLGDAKLVVREHAIKVIHKLMHHVRPAEVLSNILESKSHRNPRLREEIVNRITAAVLTFPSYSIEFSVLCEAVAPLLVDTKRRVRLAALECFAVLAQAMGPTRLIPLVTAVDTVELNFDGEGLLAAVQARLARRILPRCTEDGSVTYAVTLPSSAGYQNRTSSPSGADIDWIMAASGSSSSSTPPSRGKETNPREPSALLKKPRVIKSRSDDLIRIAKPESDNWLNYEEDATVLSPYLGLNMMHSESVQMKSSYGSGVFFKPKTEALPITKTQKGSANLGNTLLPNRIRITNEGVKTKQSVPISKIPVLASSLARRNAAVEESSILVKPTIARASSGVLRNISPSHNSRYSATQRKLPHRTAFGDEVFKAEVDKNQKDSILRKVSPGSALGPKPILVRSPSLSQLQHLPYHDYTSGYDQYGPPNKQMGNIGSYFRQSSGGVVVAQPTPIHLDNVNDINVIEVPDDHLKVPSSPSPQSWPSAELFHPVSGDSISGDRRQSPAASMPEVYDMHRSSHYSAPASINQDVATSPLNGLDNANISISKITREKMLKRQQEILKEAEERRMVRERSQQERKHLLEQRVQEEKERQQRHQENHACTEDERIEDPTAQIDSALSNGKVNDVSEEVSKPSTPLKPETPPARSTPPSNSPSNSSSKKRADTAGSKSDPSKPLSRSSSLKTPSTLRKFAQLTQPSAKNLSLSKRNFAASSLALFDDSQNGMSQYPHPDEALKKALKSLSTETWMGKIEGIQTISRLSHVHPSVLQAQLHSVVLALLTEVKNLRSSVSRAAILTMGDLFSSLKRHMEADLDLITSTLLSKSGETVGFIRDDIEKVMKLLIEAVTPNRAALAIIAGGASHRNGAVRKSASQSLYSVVEKMGAARILNAKEITERLLPVTAQFLMDGMPLTRYNGRRIFQLLMPHPGFDKLLMKHVQPSTMRNINSILNSVRKKGAGDMPKEGISAKTHKADLHRSALLNRTM